MNTNKSFTVFGELVEVLASNAGTNGSFSMITQVCEPGGGPPPHSHEREDEVFSTLEGEFELFDGAEWRKLEKGEHRVALRGSIHTFRNCGSTKGKILCIATPGGLDEYLEAISPVVMPQDHRKLIEISNTFGIKFVTAQVPELAPI
jgi:uncharacterized cupin superfamily protein